MPDAEKLAAVREALPAVNAGIYLDTATAGPLPAETAAAMAEIAEWELRTGRAGPDRRAEVEARLDEARAAVAATLAVDLDAVMLAHGIEDAITRAAAVLGPATVVVELVAADTGRRLPAVAPAARAGPGGRPRRIIDISLAAGATAVDVHALGADVVVVRSDAWLLGPAGLSAAVDLRRGPRRIAEPAPETFHLPSVVGLARSTGWLSMYVGLPWAHGRVATVSRHAARRFGAIDGVELLGDAADPGPILTFRIAGWPATSALEELGARTFLIAGTVPSLDALRLSIGCWTTTEEIDRVADGIALLAAHTPATVPPRRRLAMLSQDG